MKKGISKPILAIVFAGMALVAFVVWRGIRPAAKSDLPDPAASMAQVDGGLAKNSSDAASPAQGPSETILPGLVPLPLSVVVIDSENGMWLTNNDYLSSPRGTQSLGGIEFHVEGMLQMQGTASEASGRKYRNRTLLPLAEAGITNALMGSLHLLGGTRFTSDLGFEVAEVVWHYANGHSERSRIAYGEHIRDWNRLPYEQPARLPYPFTKVVWRADQATRAGRRLRLYRVTLDNPQPTRAVQRVELASGRGSATLFVLAATLDPLRAGERVDDSEDLEPTDATTPQYLDVWVQTPEGQPLPHAKVRLQSRLKTDDALAPTKQIAADLSGLARLTFPPTDLARLEIVASHEDFASRKMVWDIIAGDVVPASYPIKLITGVNIGGTVVDVNDTPIPDAKLSFHRFWLANDELNRKGNQPDFTSRTTTSDAQGAWAIKNLPGELLRNIMLSVEHPDYLGTNFSTTEPSTTEKELRAGTYKIVLHRGLEVRGLVTDETGQPISDATIWTGGRFANGRQQTKSDNAGHFGFPNISEGDVIFSAMAKGRKPASKNVKVSLGLSEIIFKLAPGSIIKGLVQNQAGEPVPDVTVMLEQFGTEERNYEYSTTTGTDGRFLWDSAPDEPLPFVFFKSGYAHLRGRSLKPDFENIITLRKPRQIQGQVVDADTSQPVTKFRVAIGQSLGAGTFFSNHRGTQEFADVNGQFKISLEDEIQNGIRVGADDYANQIQTVTRGEEEMTKMEFRLKPSAALHGIVVGPNGVPLPDVQVALAKEGYQSSPVHRLSRGKLEPFGSSEIIKTTDASGRFVIDSPPESGIVLTISPLGFGSATVEQVRATGMVVLQPFGKVEGVLKIAGEAAPGRELLYSMQTIGIMTEFQDFKVETDEQGKFKFDQVPPGEGQIIRLVKNGPTSWMHGHSTTVVVEPGQTTFLNLGDSGALLKGRVRFEVPPADGEALSISGNLFAGMVQPGFASPEEARAAYKTRAQQHHAVAVNLDGSFLVDSVAPGTYALTLNAYPPRSSPFGPGRTPPTATGRATITVPESANPIMPIDMGEIVLSPPKNSPWE